MRILQINTVYKIKSTGRTCFEVKEALAALGHEGFVAYGKGQHDDANTYRIGCDFDYYSHNVLSRLSGYQGYYSKSATKALIEYIEEVKPNVIHLRNLHANYLNLPSLFNFLSRSKIPVILNLHDCWSFTGKCTYYSEIGCNKWTTGCFQCPKVHEYPQSLYFDRTSQLYKDKKKWFSSIQDLIVIGVSKWISDQAKLSFLKEREILYIHNWINREVFFPRKENVRNLYGIANNKFVIVGVSASWTKGTTRYEDFIRLAEIIDADMQIVLIGRADKSLINENIKHIDYVNSTEELARLYSCANVFVHLSTEDTFGKVIAEAMSCGIPAIGYKSTAIPEVIGNECGFVVEPRNIDAIYQCLQKVKGHESGFFTEKCVNQTERLFDYKKNVRKLFEIYEHIAK